MLRCCEVIPIRSRVGTANSLKDESGCDARAIATVGCPSDLAIACRRLDRDFVTIEPLGWRIRGSLTA